MKKIVILMIIVVLLGTGISYALENIGYHSIEVKGGTLYGKMAGNTKDVVVLLVAGSGPTNMNGNSDLLEGRADTFLELSKKLSRKNIATFRYDKRTAGKSKETFRGKGMNFDYFVDDCVANIRYLKGLGYKKVIVMGHSQGSLVGMLAAAEASIDGFISVGGAGLPIDATLEKQLTQIYGEDAKEIQVIRGLREGKLDASMPTNHPILSLENQEFILTWMVYDPAEAIGRLNIPTLIIQGEADSQVNIQEFNTLREGKREADHQLIPNMNHVLKEVLNDKENVESYMDPSYEIHEKLISTIYQFVEKIKAQ